MPTPSFNYPIYEGVHRDFDLIKRINSSDAFITRVFAIPDGNLSNMAVPARGTILGNVQIPPYSRIWGLKAYSQESQGFNLMLTDKGSQLPLSSTAIFYRNLCSTPSDNPDPIAIIESTVIVTRPGMLTFIITNLAPVTNMVQVALYVAVPISDETMGTRGA